MQPIENLRKVIDGVEYVEEWKDINKYVGVYKISNFGRLASIRFKKSKILKGTIDRCGYLSYSLCVNYTHKLFSAHRLVAEYFISNPHNLPQVNHNNEIKTDNHYKNLGWITNRDNKNYSCNKRSTSKYAGVCWYGDRNKWLSQCWYNGRRWFLGNYINEIDAANAYIDFCIENGIKRDL